MTWYLKNFFFFQKKDRISFREIGYSSVRNEKRRRQILSRQREVYINEKKKFNTQLKNLYSFGQHHAKLK